MTSKIAASNPSLQYTLNQVFTWVLALMTLVVLVFNIPSASVRETYLVEAVVYGVLTPIVLFFGVWLSEGELSPAHVVGIIAFLSLPRQAYPLMTWALALGGAVGVVVLLNLHRSRSLFVTQRFQRAVFVIARVTLSFFASSQVYISTIDALPLRGSEWHSQPEITFSLLVYTLVYVTVYSAIFVLEVYAIRRSVGDFITRNLSAIAVTLLLPVPFAVLTAASLDDVTSPPNVIALLGLAVVVFGLHALSRAQFRLQRQVEELGTVANVTQALRSQLGLAQLLLTIYEQVSSVLNVDNFTVALRSQGVDDSIRYPLAVRDGERINMQTEAGRVNVFNEALIEKVLKDGVPLLISHDVRSVGSPDRTNSTREVVYSWMGVPLEAHGQKLGVMIAASLDPEQRFERDDLRLLHIVASNASIAIENAQLYEKQALRVEQLNAINRVAPLLTGTLAMDDELDMVITAASAIDQANAVAIYLYSDANESVPPMVQAAGLSARFMNDPPEPSLPEQDEAIPSFWEPLAIEDVRRDERVAHIRNLLLAENKLSYLELPLVLGESHLGILALFYDEVQVFDDQHLELLRSFAGQVAQAIDNARTYTSTDEALQRNVERLMMLATIGRSLASTMNLNNICSLILSSAMEVTRSDSGVVVLKDVAEGRLEVIASSGQSHSTLDDASLRQIVGQGAMDEGRFIIMPGDGAAGSQLASGTDNVSRLAVPIMRGGEALGFILLEGESRSKFTEEDGSFVAQIAYQAVIAIDNARLFERIIEGRDRLQVILDTVDEGLILIDSNGEIRLANFRVDLIGLDPYVMQGRLVSDLVEVEELRFVERTGFGSVEELNALISQVKEPGKWKKQEPYQYLLRERRSNLHIERQVIPVLDEVGETMGLLLVFYDKSLEYELNRARDEFSRMVIHDLRSPLTAVTTSMRLLRTVIPRESEHYPLVEQTTDVSSQVIRKLLQRVDSLLDIAKMQSGRLEIRPEVADLNSLAEAVCEALKPLAQDKNVTIKANVSQDMPLLHIDVDKVERLLTNLIDNALKYSPSNTVVLIRAIPPAPSDEAKKYVRVDVVDNGPGIPDDYKESIFEQFMQVAGRETVRRGVGLGLTFCKLVVEAHGGRIWIEDNPGGGSIFSSTLPVAGPALDKPSGD